MFKTKYKKLVSIFLVMIITFSVTSQAYAMDVIINGLCELAIESCKGGGCTGCCTNCCYDEEEIEKADIYSEDCYSEQKIFDKKTGHLIIGKDIETKRLKNIVNIPIEKIKTVTIAEGVTKICKEAFQVSDNLENVSNNLTEITIPNSVTSIGKHAFLGCDNLKEITIPPSVIEIGGEAFKWCTSLKSINVNEENPKYKSIDGVLFSKDGTRLCKYPGRKCTNSYTIPLGVKKIYSGAFASCTNLKSITISNGVEEIGGRAFYRCTNLMEITIPDSVIEIGEHTFFGCTSLKEITIPPSVTCIAKSTFDRCTSLEHISIPGSVREIGERAFNDCKSLTKVIIPSSVKQIGNQAFSGCSVLGKVFIPYPKFVSIHRSAFSYSPYLRIIDCIEAEKENSSDPM